MVTFLSVIVFVISFKYFVNGYADLIPEAITVYRNPKFFKNLNYGTQINHSQKPAKTSEGHKNYPGETKKSNPPLASPGFEVSYDNSPEFHHEPRDVFVDITYNPKRKGPYSLRHRNGTIHGLLFNSKVPKPIQETENEEDGKKSKESAENESREKPRDFVSVFDENVDEEFKTYHEPVLLAGPYFDPAQSSGLASSTYNKPYPFNRSIPIPYENWKFYNYPKIHSNKHLKSDSKIYSEEFPSNSFEDEHSSYYRYDDEIEDASSLPENNDEFKNLGADTKHIYKKLLKPKKSFLFKFYSKPKFQKIKLNLKKKHPLKTDWFDHYPFNF